MDSQDPAQKKQQMMYVKQSPSTSSVIMMVAIVIGLIFIQLAIGKWLWNDVLVELLSWSSLTREDKLCILAVNASVSVDKRPSKSFIYYYIKKSWLCLNKKGSISWAFFKFFKI